MTPTAAGLAADVASRLGPALGSNLTSASRAYDLYEAYTMTLVVSAARQEGFAVSFESVRPGPANTVTFRTSPGHIYTSTQPYSYAVLEAPNGVTVEAHVGVRALGKSRVAHECDVIVLDRDEAVACRTNRVDPLHTHAQLAVECKFYAQSVGLDLLRGFVGLSADVQAPYGVLVSNVTSSSVAQMFKSLKRNWEDHLTPSSAAEERFIGNIRSVLHKHQSQ